MNEQINKYIEALWKFFYLFNNVSSATYCSFRSVAVVKNDLERMLVEMFRCLL